VAAASFDHNRIERVLDQWCASPRYASLSETEHDQPRRADAVDFAAVGADQRRDPPTH
jgi:hypothetical protein